MLEGKKIILGVCGSIAAYKAALVVRLLVRAGAEVRVLMTPAATGFISELTLATLSRHEVVTSVHDGESWNNHVELGLWADAMVIAPITATTLGKLANGICDTAIAAVYLSARCPVFFAPAMDLDMWAHPATVANVAKLRTYGNHLIDVGRGELASGLSGAGRLAEPETIVEVLRSHFARPAATVPQHCGRAGDDLRGKRVTITAGPSYEDLDPVRYLGNRSTGRMGIALAEAAAARGADVTLLLGPSELAVHPTAYRTERFRSATQLLDLCSRVRAQTDIFIFAAAVADYRPAEVAEQKIKKEQGDLTLRLVRNPDVAHEMGRLKTAGQLLVGFALETDNELANARRKLTEKDLDLIVLNSPSNEGTGFGHTTNRVRLVDHNKVTDFELKPKRAVAEDILDAVARFG